MSIYRELEKKVRKRQINILRGDLDSLEVQGVLFEDIEMPDELRQAIIDYYAGKGISLNILRKYYGLGGSLTIRPTPKQLRGSSGYAS